MQEISPHVYVDTSFPGVTLGAMNGAHGLVLIDAPFRQDDIRAWRTALLNLGGGVDRLLINLDAHFDRTLGVRGMESTVVAHEKVAAIFRDRPLNFKVQGTQTGAEWELHNGIGTVRWAPPDLTFSESMLIHWNDSPLRIEHHPGPSNGAAWVVLPDQRVIFLGDAVVVSQPPFLSGADLPVWIENLRGLLQPARSDYLLVSGRGGLVTSAQVRQQLSFLERLHAALEELAGQKAAPEDAALLAPRHLAGLDIPESLQDHYLQRLRWGLYQYFARHYRQMAIEEE